MFKDLIVDKCANQAYKTALKLFDKDTANFVAIDGTEYSKMLFDMIVFYAGAFSYENTISFSSKDEENKIQVKYQNRFLNQ